MKIIFLDFDGVLCETHYSHNSNTFEIYSPEWYAQVIDENKIQLLNQIIAKTKAKVVVSSAWRSGKSINFLQNILDVVGFQGEVIGKTKTGQGYRGKQIGEWLNNAKLYIKESIESFVIIDDSNDMEPFSYFLVQTNYKEGLTQKHVDRLVDMLNHPPLMI